MDLTLNEALADEDVCAIGRAEDGPEKEKIANFVEKMKDVVDSEGMHSQAQFDVCNRWQSSSSTFPLSALFKATLSQ